jgi:hypothetical protein
MHVVMLIALGCFVFAVGAVNGWAWRVQRTAWRCIDVALSAVLIVLATMAATELIHCDR